MGITGVGSSYNFIYNTKTGKLSTKDGSKNEFVDFCNGDVKGEDTETLNHFDEHTRYQFTRMLFAYGTGMTGQNPFANDEKVEITADIDSATLASNNVNNIVNDTSKYDEYKEKVKELEKELQTRKDTFEKMTEPLVYVCDCYQKFNVVTGMPKSTFGDSFGYAMQKEISDYMQDFYAGKVSSEELDSYFEKCCTSMRTYRTGQHQTSGTNEADNTQIVSEMYEVFAKENARAAGQANYQEGKALNEKYYSDGHSDWTYYNSDYYYQCNDTNAALRESARKMTEKWELDGIDCDEIEANSSLTLDGGFDFNSIWNSDFRNQVGRSSLAKESTIPPENFKMFFKEQVTSFTEDNKFNGNLKITIGKNNSDLDVPFQTLRTGPEGEIRNVWDLMKDYYSNTEDNSKVKNFLSNMSVFTRWYSYETGINDKFGDY